jgi:hypothetical protein
MKFRVQQAILKFSAYYTLDLRALAIMRIGVAFLVLLDLYIRSDDLYAFYNTQGLLPTHLAFQFVGKPGIWSLCNFFQSFNWIIFLFIANVIFAILFLFGYKTRLSNLILWLLTLSFQNRNLFILQAGDDLLRLILFWGLFLPWQYYFSFEKKNLSILKPHALASVAYLLLIASVYFFSALLKNSPQWQTEGSAIYFALSLDTIKGAYGDWLYQFPWLMKTLTYFIYYLEFLIPILILWPSKNGKLRGLAFILILFTHSAFGIFLNVGLFYLISIVCALGLISKPTLDNFLSQSNKNSDMKSSNLNTFKYRLENFCIIICLTLSLSINFSSLNYVNYQPKKQIMYLVYFLRLDQYWGMFAPAVPNQNKWLVHEAFNGVGQTYDIKNNEPLVSFSKPNNFKIMFKNDRWRKYCENLQSNQFTFLQPIYCKFILRNWNEKHPEDKMTTLNLYSMNQIIYINYKSALVQKNILCVCDEN